LGCRRFAGPIIQLDRLDKRQAIGRVSIAYPLDEKKGNLFRVVSFRAGDFKGNGRRGRSMTRARREIFQLDRQRSNE
jgi:hypothetical protein